MSSSDKVKNEASRNFLKENKVQAESKALK